MDLGGWLICEVDVGWLEALVSVALIASRVESLLGRLVCCPSLDLIMTLHSKAARLRGQLRSFASATRSFY